MRRDPRLRVPVLAAVSGLLLTLIFTLVACSGGSEQEGRIRVTAAQVAGIYELGSERLELKADGTYIQDAFAETRVVHHSGYWRIVNHFLDGSEVLLINAAITEPATPEGNPPRLVFGDLPMYAHKRSDKVALARNEVAGWYYEHLR